MKCQILFSGKKKSNKISSVCHLLSLPITRQVFENSKYNLALDKRVFR